MIIGQKFRLQSVRLFPQIRLPVKVREHDDHEEVLQETHGHHEGKVRTVLHDQWPPEMDEQDEKLKLKGIFQF